MNVVETVAEGETAATHAHLTPMHSAIRPTTTYSSPAIPIAPPTPPPAMLQPVAATSLVPQASPNNTKILPSSFHFTTRDWAGF